MPRRGLREPEGRTEQLVGQGVRGKGGKSHRECEGLEGATHGGRVAGVQGKGGVRQPWLS